MESNSKTKIAKDFNEKSILVSRVFNVPLASVWRAYTESELLAQWWAPGPWKAETKVMNFTVGGYWLYAMVSPEGEKHWGRMNYVAMDYHKSFNIEDCFCDENGNPINTGFTSSLTKNSFKAGAGTTTVQIVKKMANLSELEQFIAMGFKEGVTAGLANLDEFLLTLVTNK